MSTPVAKPFRSDSIRLLVHKGAESVEQAQRRGEREGAGEPPNILKVVEDDAAPGQAGTGDDSPSPAEMAEGVLEHPDPEPGDDRRAREGEDDKPDDGGLEAQDQSADARRRRAQAAEIDKGYEERLQGLAHNLQALRREAKPADPEQSTPLPLDGMVLQRFIQSSDFGPPERGTNRLGAILRMGIAGAVGATIAYYFAVGNPFPSGSNEPPLRPGLQHAMGPASVWEPVSEVGQSESARGQNLANAEPPNAVSGKRQQARQLSDPVPTALEHPAEPAAPAQTSSAVPLTSALASAPASAPVEPQPAPARAMAIRPGGMDPDQIQLLLKQGKEFVAVGDLATARVVLRRAAEAGAVDAAFALAQCYDPKVLTRMRVWGVAPDIGEARRWYEIARQLGSAEAARRLELLPSE
jgi:hypothetical protein